MVDKARLRLLMMRWSWRTWRDRLAMQIAWWLPRWLVYFAVIRVWAHATTKLPAWQQDHPSSITWDEALKRWEVTV